MRIRPAVLPTVADEALVWLPSDIVDVEGIKADLTYAHPAHVKARQQRRWPPADVPPTIALYAERAGQLGVPRHWLWRERSGLWRFDRQRTARGGRLVRIESAIELRPHQVAPVRALTWRDGLLEAPCGSGKTIVLLEAISRIGRLALVLVHTTVLLEQWFERATSFLDLRPDEIGLIGMGQKKGQEWASKRLVLGLVQSVKRGLPSALQRDLGLVVTDEVHHASAPTWLESILACRARRRIGASATMERGDGMEFVFYWHIGPVVARMSAPRLEPVIWVRKTKIKPDPEETGEIREDGSAADPNWVKLGTALSHDAKRNRLVESYIRAAAEQGRCILVLVDRVKHAIRLAGRVADLVPGCCIGQLKGDYARLAEELGVEVSPSGTSGPRRELRAEHMERQIIISTADLVKEGFDKPELDTLIDVGIYADKIRAVQTIGRILRPAEGKARPVAVFFLDDHPICRGTMRKRLKPLYRDDYDIRENAPRQSRRAFDEKRLVPKMERAGA